MNDRSYDNTFIYCLQEKFFLFCHTFTNKKYCQHFKKIRITSFPSFSLTFCKGLHRKTASFLKFVEKEWKHLQKSVLFFTSFGYNSIRPSGYIVSIIQKARSKRVLLLELASFMRHSKANLQKRKRKPDSLGNLGSLSPIWVAFLFSITKNRELFYQWDQAEFFRCEWNFEDIQTEKLLDLKNIGFKCVISVDYSIYISLIFILFFKNILIMVPFWRNRSFLDAMRKLGKQVCCLALIYIYKKIKFNLWAFSFIIANGE